MPLSASRPVKRIAVLGAGIMGSATALFLARRGHAVSLIDAAARPMSAASRWNEGKIHLGYLYSADPSLRTARHVLTGSLQFAPLTEELIGCPVAPATTATDDVYLCHRASVVAADAMAHYYRQVDDLVRSHADAARYLVDVRGARSERLDERALRAITDSPDIAAGFQVPERSVSTGWIADRFVEALAAEPAIELQMGTGGTAVRPQQADDPAGRWRVETADGVAGVYDHVVNALWQGRLPIDVTAGLAAPQTWSNRYRLSLFVRTNRTVDAPSVLIATGPFGDIKNYNGRDFYLSWYPRGLMVDSSGIAPPPAPAQDAAREAAISREILERLTAILPCVERIASDAESMVLRGGWVSAAGRGVLSDPRSTLHRRDEFGIVRLGSYVSVDTGKYASAPLLAHRIAQSLG